MKYYILLLISLIISIFASVKVRNNYAKFSKISSSSGLTGSQVAKLILNKNGIYDVTIQPINGVLTDHYDPKSKVVRLSQGIYDSDSISAVSIAAHEVGHAIQDNEGYYFLRFRSSLAPVVNFTSKFTFLIIMTGFALEMLELVDLGILLLSLSVLFHIITLPVELDASKRAMETLVTNNIINEKEKFGTRKVLSAAAMTYVASMLVSVIELFRLISIRNSRD